MITLEIQSLQQSRFVLLMIVLVLCIVAPLVSIAKNIGDNSIEVTGPGGLSFLYDPFSGQAGYQSIELAVEALSSSLPSTGDSATISSSTVANKRFNLRIRPAESELYR